MIVSPKRRKARRRTEFGLSAGCDTFNPTPSLSIRLLSSFHKPRSHVSRQSVDGTMARMTSRELVVVLGLFAAATAAVAQAPRGQREPDTPAPSIHEYKPQSTLVVPQHPVPRAKFPAIDMHGHPPPLTSPAAVQNVVGAMDALNLRIMVVTGNPGRISREQMRQGLEVLRGSPHKNRFAVFANIDFRNVGPGFGQKVAAQLEEDVKAGAMGLGEIMKDFGL